MARSAPKKKLQARGDDVVRKIVAGGLRVFLQSGYEGTSVQAVAAATKTSKETIYRHFADKEALFTAIVRHAYETRPKPIDFRMEGPGNVRAALIDFGKRWIEAGLSPAQIELMRVITFEIGRFPEIETIILNANQDGSNWFVDVFTELGAMNILQIDNGPRAAGTFSSLVSYPITMQALFRPSLPLKSAELELLITMGVEDFLRIYPPSKGATRG